VLSELVLGVLSNPSECVVAGSWKIPLDSVGGDYTLKIEHWIENFPIGERTFNIRQFSTPTLKLQLDFPRKGFGPGDDCLAKLEAFTAEGEACREGKGESTNSLLC